MPRVKAESITGVREKKQEQGMRQGKRTKEHEPGQEAGTWSQGSGQQEAQQADAHMRCVAGMGSFMLRDGKSEVCCLSDDPPESAGIAPVCGYQLQFPYLALQHCGEESKVLAWWACVQGVAYLTFTLATTFNIANPVHSKTMSQATNYPDFDFKITHFLKKIHFWCIFLIAFWFLSLQCPHFQVCLCIPRIRKFLFSINT